MEEEEDSNTSKKCTPKTISSFRGTQTAHTYHHHHHHQLLHNPYSLGYGFTFNYQNQYQYQYQYKTFPPLLPLPPPTIPLQLNFPQNQSFPPRTHFKKPSINHHHHHHHLPLLPTPSQSHLQDSPLPQEIEKNSPPKENGTTQPKQFPVARRPDSGGVAGKPITLLANHFLVKFDPTQKIFHYDVEILPNPSKEIARIIKKKLVLDNPSLLSSYDGRRTLYSPVQFQNQNLEFFITLPLSPDSKSHKIFRVNIKLVSKFDAIDYEYENRGSIPLPQEYIHALDVVLRENPTDTCLSAGRSFYSSSMGGGTKEIGGGAIALGGFFQSLRQTQQGLSLNVDFSVTAFHESIGVIPYLQKRLEFFRDNLSRTNALSNEERNEVEKALKNMRIFVRHRDTVQRYRVYGLTVDTTENLSFNDRDGTSLRLVSYFKDHYGYDVKYLHLPCLQISRRKPCYLPMELCVICEGQKFLGKLSDEQTVKMLKMGCQRPKERKAIIDSVMKGPVGPTGGEQGREFKLEVSREMTKLTGRILQPPKLKLGNGGHVRNLTPFRTDRQWNLLDSHVFEGTRVERWAIVSFGGSPDQKSSVPRFVSQLCHRCEQLGIFLNKNTVVCPIYEPMHVLGNPKLLESKLKNIHKSASGNLQLLICVMERKHKGYADLKRIAETSIGIVSQCCLYSNLGKLNSQFLANLALKINAKVGGCTVALYNSLHSQIPRLFSEKDPVIFMGADVTHPHPLDDSSPSVAAVVGSVNWPASNKYVSRMRSQTHRQEIIQDLSAMVCEILHDFNQELNQLPKRIIFFRDGVSETQFQKVLEEELRAIREACTRFPDYEPPITFAVVQKRHHTRLFKCENENEVFDENVSPGTVVDSVITHPRDFDFYLCSHWGVKGTSRPVHYHILWDENGFTSDEVQKLVYNLCYTFVRCTKPISLVPPAYYAHLAAYRGRLYLERSDASVSISRASTPKAVPLPKLSENISKLMFYC